MTRVAMSRREFLAGTAALASFPFVAKPAAAPGLLLYGGPIYTGVRGRPQAEAILTTGERIAYVGGLSEARRRGRGAREINLRGAAAFPGFVDAHAHFTGVGLRELTLNLDGTRSVPDLVKRLLDFAQSQPVGPIVGRGWIETHWPEPRLPTRRDLDVAVPDRPVYLRRADGHAGIANSAALAIAGIDARTADPAGGRIVRDASGEATGMLIDTAEALVSDRMPKPDAAMIATALARADARYAGRGWTGVHSMGVLDHELAALLERADAGQQRLRVDNYLDPTAAARVLERGPFAHPAGRVHVRGLKFYADGSLGSRGAALLAPYSDAPDTSGLVQMKDDEALDWFERARRAGTQVAVHAIGDRGNRLALDWYARVLGQGSARYRWRIEHAQTIAPEDIPRFHAMGVIASMQPSHAIGDLYFAPGRLGRDRLRGAYAWRALLDAGAVVCAGSDAPVEKGDPLVEFYAAVYRHSLDGHAGEDWGLDQVVSRSEALTMLTAAPAFAVGCESRLGTLEAGKLADVSVFSADLMTVPPPAILRAEAVLTVIGGTVAWDAATRVAPSGGR